MSLVKCRTIGCPHRTREGYRNGRLVGLKEGVADGVFCWRCRRKQISDGRVIRACRSGAQP